MDYGGSGKGMIARVGIRDSGTSDFTPWRGHAGNANWSWDM